MAGKIPKNIVFDDEARKKLKSGIDKIAKVVCSSLGPLGRTTLIEDVNIVGSYKISKDGVSIARSVNFLDAVEDLAATMVKSAAEASVTASGDGTTTTICLVQALLEAAESYEDLKYNMSEIIRFINKYTLELEAELERTSLKITKKRALNIAIIASNNDPKIGKLVADVYSQVKHVTIEDSPSSETYTKVTNGIKIERGWVSNIMINNQKTQECILEDAYILVTDTEIKEVDVLVPILQFIMSEDRSILIIGTFSPNALFTLNKNIVENGLKACVIIPPGFGYAKDDLMNDLGIALNATFVNEKTGDNLQGLSISDLGLAKKIVVGKDYTVIVRDTNDRLEVGINPDGSEYEQTVPFVDRIPQHVSDLKEMLKHTNSYIDKKNLNERIANISGGVGVIFVGANSPVEQKELLDRIEDAVFAVKSAIEFGISPGGGIALINSLKAITCDSNDVNKMAAFDILNEALQAPFKTIVSNTGVDVTTIVPTIEDSKTNGFGYNAKTREFGMMEEMGIIDATKVTRNALKNAVSVAGTIMSTAAVISNIRE